MTRDPGSHPDRNCSDADPEVFFPPTTDISANRAVIRTYCAPCPITDICLEWALAMERGHGYSGRSGIYGGMSPRQRADLARRRNKAAAA
jgi:hypothetical protein